MLQPCFHGERSRGQIGGRTNRKRSIKMEGRRGEGGGRGGGGGKEEEGEGEEEEKEGENGGDSGGVVDQGFVEVYFVREIVGEVEGGRA